MFAFLKFLHIFSIFFLVIRTGYLLYNSLCLFVYPYFFLVFVILVSICSIWIKTLNINPCKILTNYKPNSIVKKSAKMFHRKQLIRILQIQQYLNYLAIVIFEALWLQDLFKKSTNCQTIVRQYIIFFKLLDFFDKITKNIVFLVHCWFKQLVGFHGCHMSKFVFGIEFIMYVIYVNRYNIRGYIDREKCVVNLGS